MIEKKKILCKLCLLKKEASEFPLSYLSTSGRRCQSCMSIVRRYERLKEGEAMPIRNLEHEQWRDIPGLEGKYAASDLGRIKSYELAFKKVLKGVEHLCTRKERIMSGYKHVSGYRMTEFFKNSSRETRLTHRLIAFTWCENPHNKPHVNHINGIKHDNRASNLEWVTNHENILHASRMGFLRGRMSEEQKAEVTKRIVALKERKVGRISRDGEILEVFHSCAEADRHFNLATGAVSQMCRGNYKSKNKNLVFSYLPQ